jgi:hypothetical protein
MLPTISAAVPQRPHVTILAQQAGLVNVPNDGNGSCMFYTLCQGLGYDISLAGLLRAFICYYIMRYMWNRTTHDNISYADDACAAMGMNYTDIIEFPSYFNNPSFDISVAILPSIAECLNVNIQLFSYINNEGVLNESVNTYRSTMPTNVNIDIAFNWFNGNGHYELLTNVANYMRIVNMPRATSVLEALNSIPTLSSTLNGSNGNAFAQFIHDIYNATGAYDTPSHVVNQYLVSSYLNNWGMSSTSTAIPDIQSDAMPDLPSTSTAIPDIQSDAMQLFIAAYNRLCAEQGHDTALSVMNQMRGI